MAHLQRTRLAAGVLGVIAVLGLASCGGGDDSSSDGAATTIASKEAGSVGGATEGTDGASGGADGTTDATEAEPITMPVGKTGWWGGFAITVDELEAAPSFGGTGVTLHLTYQNLGDETATAPDGQVVIDGQVADMFPDRPQVPGQGKTKGTMDFVLDDELDEAALTKALGTVQLVYGEARDNQTTLPLLATGTVSSTEPKVLKVSGKLTQGDIIAEVLSGTLSPSYESGEKGKAVLSLRFKVSCGPTCQASGYNVDRDNFSVKGADGTSAVADDRSAFCCDAVYPGDVLDDSDHELSFVVPLPGTGAWTLTMNVPAITSAGTAPATLALTV